MQMRVSDAIVNIVEFALPKFSDKERMLHVCVDARIVIHACDDDLPEQYREDRYADARIHFLFQRPTAYTKVFVAIEGYEYAKIEDGSGYPRKAWVQIEGMDACDQQVYHASDLNKLRWEMTSDHDSCWRSDGVDSVLFQIERQLIDQITEGDDFLLKKMHCHHNFDTFSKPKFVKGEVVVDKEANERDGRVGDNYRKKPMNIEEIE